MKSKNVKKVVFDIIGERGRVTSSQVAREAGVTRQAAHYHLKKMVEAGDLTARGAGRGAHYLAADRVKPGVSSPRLFEFPLAGLEEDQVWRRLAGEFAGCSRLEEQVLQYAFTELLNNAIEHSQGEKAMILIEPGAGWAFEIADDGIGIFERIKSDLGFADHLEALQELSKGKLTTRPDRHSGEGIFFVSKAVNRFTASSDGLSWVVDNLIGDQGIKEAAIQKGTRVRCELLPGRSRALEEVFAEYTEEFRFTKTRTVVKLFAYGVNLISRSEARRLLARLEDFSEVVLDFAGVEGIGQGFADEVFRVWAGRHPEVRLEPVNMNKPVEFMVRRALSSA